MIAIIDLKLGNIASICNIIKKNAGDYFVCSDPKDLATAKKVILPGVGSFDSGICALYEGGWIKPLNHFVFTHKKPVLGICLGMQLMCLDSQEGKLKGLGWIEANVKRFYFLNANAVLKIPHMGWNTLDIKKENMLINPNDDERFYFVHSYYVDCLDKYDILSTTNYGHDFTSAFSKNNIYGVQFHPEKSHRFGMKLIKNFIDL